MLVGISTVGCTILVPINSRYQRSKGWMEGFVIESTFTFHWLLRLLGVGDVMFVRKGKVGVL